jgi:hypothetical protein
MTAILAALAALLAPAWAPVTVVLLAWLTALSVNLSPLPAASALRAKPVVALVIGQVLGLVQLASLGAATTFAMSAMYGLTLALSALGVAAVSKALWPVTPAWITAVTFGKPATSKPLA